MIAIATVNESFGIGYKGEFLGIQARILGNSITE